MTRPDISFPMSVVSHLTDPPYDKSLGCSYLQSPTYKSTPGKGLLFKDRGHEQNVG